MRSKEGAIWRTKWVGRREEEYLSTVSEHTTGDDQLPVYSSRFLPRNLVRSVAPPMTMTMTMTMAISP